MATSLSFDRLRHDVADVLAEPPDSLTADEDLFDRGLDSIRIMTLVTRWRADGFDPDYADLAEDPTLQAWMILAEKR